MIRGKANLWISLSCWTILAGFFFLQFRSIYTETINWDEFALASRARQSLDTGTLFGGGRPGLATILLMPVVKHAASEVEAIHTGRVLWFFFTLIFVVGTNFYLKVALKTESCVLPFLGVALLIMNPCFIRCSIQIRTDQLALAFSILACICLLQRAPEWHIFGGILFAAGFLSTQKALYVMGIGLAVAYLRPLITRDFQARYHGVRLLIFGLAFGIVIEGWQLLTSFFFHHNSLGHSVGRQLDIFDFYSQTKGYSYYTAHPHFWYVQMILALALLVQTAFYLRARKRFPLDLMMAISVLSLGIFVGIFHKAAFPYFLMVLGLFPAIGFSFSLQVLFSETLPYFSGKENLKTCCLALMFFGMLAVSLPHIISQQSDTQKIQRESLNYVHENFYGRFEGFQAEGALFLQPSKSRFRIYFTQHIFNEFGAGIPERKENTEAFIQKFYENRVGYIVRSYRMNQFPDEIRTFWNTHYVPWKGSVYLAGAFLDFNRGMRQAVDLVVAGCYVWIPVEGERPIRIDGSIVAPHQPAKLKAGVHVVDSDQHGVRGRLVLESAGGISNRFQPVFYAHGFNF